MHIDVGSNVHLSDIECAYHRQILDVLIQIIAPQIIPCHVTLFVHGPNVVAHTLLLPVRIASGCINATGFNQLIINRIFTIAHT